MKKHRHEALTNPMLQPYNHVVPAQVPRDELERDPSVQSILHET